MKPRIFLGSSGQQEKLLQALTLGLRDIADVEPWTTEGTSPEAASGQASPRDNVVFEAGLFGGPLSWIESNGLRMKGGEMAMAEQISQPTRGVSKRAHDA